MAFLALIWSKIQLYVMAAAGAFIAIGAAFLYGLHKGDQAGTASVAAKASSIALKEALDASKTRAATSALAPGKAQQAGADEFGT